MCICWGYSVYYIPQITEIVSSLIGKLEADVLSAFDLLRSLDIISFMARVGLLDC